MSRRHHGRSQHDAHRPADGGRRAAGVSPSPLGGPTTDTSHAATPLARPQGQGQGQGEPVVRPDGPAAAHPLPAQPLPAAPDTTPANGAPHPPPVPHLNGAPTFAPHPAHAGGPPQSPGQDRNGQCTAPQLRRFIKSRPYVPMHELRRRFGIDGQDDDVTPVRLDPGWVYVGLPSREGSLLGDLLRAGEIGYELSLDPRTPIVIGVYPMRPIPRG
jgi:hypothetical protein